MTLNDIQTVVDAIAFLDRQFVVLPKGDGFLLQMRYMEPDVETGVPTEQHTRKWYLSSHATVSEIVQTALKCVLTSQEHIAREHFTYKCQRIYGPHLNAEALVRLSREGQLKQDRRLDA